MWMYWPWGVCSVGSLQQSLREMRSSHPASVLWKITREVLQTPGMVPTGAGSEHLMWHSTFAIEGKMCLQTLHCAGLQGGLNPETSIPVEVTATFNVFWPFSRVNLLNSFHTVFLCNTKKQVAAFALITDCCCVVLHPWVIFRCPCPGPGWVLVLLPWICEEGFASSHASSFASLKCCTVCFVCPKAPL